MPAIHRACTAAFASIAALSCAVAVGAPACARALTRVPIVQGQPASLAELWQEPPDLTTRDLFHGAGGPELAPAEGSTFSFLAEDSSGWSPGFDVRSADDLDWSVKLGPEAQSEVASSRILWAVGFHQPPTYYVQRWSMTGAMQGPQEPGRFRPALKQQEAIADWSWYENPFVGTREFGGLIVTNLILNSWDWKTSNNKVYRLSQSTNGVSRWFIVRDLGASLGETTYPAILKWFRLRGFGQGTRNDLPGFEAQGFITSIDGDDLEFDYSGIYRDVVDSVTPADVLWACQRLSRLSDRQWNDAFRAAAYNPEQTARYVAKIRLKIAQGLTLAAVDRTP
jgi:hypothetical protein